MNIAEAIVRKIEKDGIVLADRKYLHYSIDKAIEEGRFDFVTKDGKNIGFFSWEVTKDGIFGENLFIDREYRGTFNLMWIVRYLRTKFPEAGALHWKNRKRNKPVQFKKRSICCSQ